MSKLWRIEGDKVMRGSRIVAKIYTYPDPEYGLGWTGLNDIRGWTGLNDIRRCGFETPEEILEDVKYFHRYRPPNVVLRFKSGIKAVIP